LAVKEVPPVHLVLLDVDANIVVDMMLLTAADE